MKKATILFIILMFFFLNQNIYSQEVYYGVGGGLTFVLGPDAYTSSIDTAGRNFDLSSNYHLGGKFKIGVGNTPVMLGAYLYYSSFSGSQNNVVVQNTAIDYETSTSLWTLGVGAEYHFNPRPFSPYAGIDLQFNNQNDLNFKRVFPNTERTISTSGWTRVGLAFGGGFDLALLPQLDLDTALKFNFLNLFGQQDGEQGFNTFTITLNLLYSPKVTTNK